MPAVSKLDTAGSFETADFPVPNGREEEWRFTPLRRLRGLHTGPDGTEGGEGAVSVAVEAEPAVRVETVGLDDERVGASFTPLERVSALAYRHAAGATLVTVPKETQVERPVVVAVRGERPGQAFGHTVVRLEPFATATVVLDHAGSATYADNVEFVVGDGAALTVVSVHDWGRDAVHVAYHHVSLGRDARFRGHAVTLGGDLVRVSATVRYTAPGGDAELNGVYFTDAGQHHEHRLLVDHSQSHCRSRVEYKGALQGDDAHAVWIGDVIIGVGTEGTDTYEYNRNLVLTDNTRVDSVPNLEIFTGEVLGAGHASASGRLDDLHLFYLQARGIEAEEARRLVVRGFFAEMIARLGVPEVEERLTAAIERELERSA